MHSNENVYYDSICGVTIWMCGLTLVLMLQVRAHRIDSFKPSSSSLSLILSKEERSNQPCILMPMFNDMDLCRYVSVQPGMVVYTSQNASWVVNYRILRQSTSGAVGRTIFVLRMRFAMSYSPTSAQPAPADRHKFERRRNERTGGVQGSNCKEAIQIALITPRTSVS